MSNSVCFHVCHGFVFFARSCVLTTLQSYNVTIHTCPLQNSVWVHCQPPRVQELTPELLTLIQDCCFLLRNKAPSGDFEILQTHDIGQSVSIEEHLKWNEHCLRVGLQPCEWSSKTKSKSLHCRSIQNKKY